MRIRTTYPGQPEQVIEAPAHIAEHFKTKGWPLPFVALAPDGLGDEDQEDVGQGIGPIEP